jgi:predicted XRE-type DNA-binding protein
MAIRRNKVDGSWDDARARYAAAITRAVLKRGLTQRQAGDLIGLKQSDVSNLKRGLVASYSLEKLIQAAARIGISTKLEAVSGEKKGTVKIAFRG